MRTPTPRVRTDARRREAQVLEDLRPRPDRKRARDGGKRRDRTDDRRRWLGEDGTRGGARRAAVSRGERRERTGKPAGGGEIRDVRRAGGAEDDGDERGDRGRAAGAAGEREGAGDRDARDEGADGRKVRRRDVSDREEEADAGVPAGEDSSATEDEHDRERGAGAERARVRDAYVF